MDPRALDFDSSGRGKVFSTSLASPRLAAIVPSGQLPLFFENKGGPRRPSALPQARRAWRASISFRGFFPILINRPDYPSAHSRNAVSERADPLAGKLSKVQHSPRGDAERDRAQSGWARSDLSPRRGY